MDQARSVAATFTLKQRHLDVNATGTGPGYVQSSPAGIDCSAADPFHTDCSEDFTDGTGVDLVAHSAANSAFSGWSGGGCTGAAVTCHLTMDQARSVTATFTRRAATVKTCPNCPSTGPGQTTLVIGSSPPSASMEVIVNVTFRGQVVASRVLALDASGAGRLDYAWKCGEVGQHDVSVAPTADPGYHASGPQTSFVAQDCAQRWDGDVGRVIAGHRTSLKLDDAWRRQAAYRVCLIRPHRFRSCADRQILSTGWDRWRPRRRLEVGSYRVEWFIDGQIVTRTRFWARRATPGPSSGGPCHRGLCATCDPGNPRHGPEHLPRRTKRDGVWSAVSRSRRVAL